LAVEKPDLGLKLSLKPSFGEVFSMITDQWFDESWLEHSSPTQFPRTKIFTIFCYRTITRLMQTIVYVCVKLNI